MIPSLIVAIAIITGTIAVVVRGIKTARASERRFSFASLMVILILGLAVGIWVGVFGEFQINERMRVQGAPVPLVVFVLEGQNWTDFVKPRLVGYLCLLANALFPVGVLTLLWRLVKL